MTAAAIVIASTSLVGPALGSPAAAAAASSGETWNSGLTPMPQGQFTLSAGSVRLTGYGFTPGSSHEVAESSLGAVTPLGTLTADPTGSVSWSGSMPTPQRILARHEIKPDAAGGGMHGIQLVIRDAGAGTPVIAQTTPISAFGTYAVHAVEPGWGVIRDALVSISYDPAARALSVTVDASGLTPGAHAAHIHAGSCRRQGGVVYSLTDFTANAYGAIVHETRTVTGVTTVNFGGGWYFNLHQGNAGTITSNGNPTIFFRPLLCSNI
jgi:hypothetical protein